ncbi:zebrafish testis-expressed 38 isoform X1 [Phyllopteryx taeniolatus]|uniref:zebrafish testis-expressed 38 isoform X1 n=1 Tax=Phyllopteryx taeniolatus TaxID=161469 RepID=UPI002AD2D449|nr:zebrafish testis-expressed 38 isoform X1 [Phyllopteryx taeniolatus]
MAAGMCVRKSKEDTAEWTGLFATNVKSKEQSLAFAKRMLAVAVSSITYLRGIFPEHAYRPKYLEDLCIKILREDCRTTGANKVVKWLFGCFDALEKQYLEVVFIGVYTNPNEPNHIIESYSFKFKYTATGPGMDILGDNGVEVKVTMEDTKRASVLLIRKLFLLLQNLSVLPHNIHLAMKLYYYDEITPADYEPPGFKEGTCDSLWFEGTAVHFTVGDVQTTFHNFQVRVSADQSRLEKLQDRDHQETKQMITSEREVDMGPCKIVSADDDRPSEDESSQFKRPTKPVVKVRSIQGTLMQSTTWEAFAFTLVSI